MKSTRTTSNVYAQHTLGVVQELSALSHRIQSFIMKVQSDIYLLAHTERNTADKSTSYERSTQQLRELSALLHIVVCILRFYTVKKSAKHKKNNQFTFSQILREFEKNFLQYRFK